MDSCLITGLGLKMSDQDYGTVEGIGAYCPEREAQR